MRVDVFLKAARIVKRRTIAKELCEEGAVKLNGQTARAGRDVHAGDELGIRMRHRHLRLTVLDVPGRAPSPSQAASLYEIVSDVRVDVDGSDVRVDDDAEDLRETRTH